MNPLGPEARQLLLLASPAALDEDRKERVWTGIVGQSPLLGSAAETGPTRGLDGSTSSSGFVRATGYRARARALGRRLARGLRAARFALPLWGWGIGVALAAGATWVATHDALKNPPQTPALPAPSASSASSSAVPGAGTPRAERSAEPVALPSDSAAPALSASAIATEPAAATPQPSAKAPADVTRLSKEVASLDRVYRALDEGRPEQALLLLQDHLNAFPERVLQQEAQAARVIARCRTSSDAKTRDFAATFLKRLGPSPLAERVRRACLEHKGSP